MLEKKTQLAEQKIARAQEQATSEVKAKAVDVSIMAAKTLISQKIPKQVSDDLIDASIQDVNNKLN